MAKTKSKIDFKQLLLNKGEYIALGVAGFFLVILLFSGVGKWLSAQDPAKIADGLKTSAKSVHTKISGTQISPEDEKATVLPPWVTKENKYPPVDVLDFPTTGPQFDPIAKPDTKKENPNVFGLQGANYQVDLTRCSFQAFDIRMDGQGNAQIAVIADKTILKMDETEKRRLIRNFKKTSERLLELEKRQNSNPIPAGPAGVGPGGPGGMGPGGMGPGMGPGRPGLGGSGSMGPGGPGGMGLGGRPGGQGFDTNGQRTEKTIQYIPIEDLDKEMANGKIPAMTVIPFEAVIIHAEIPYKKQIEEIKRALRLSSNADAMKWGPIYDGYEVQRKVSRVVNGQLEEVSGWSPYQFEDTYQEKVNSKKLADTIEGGFLSFFLRYEMALALPLPQLVTELGSYPDIRLENINNTIKKLKESGQKNVQPSDTLERLRGRKPRNEMYQLQSAGDTGASAFYTGLGGPGAPPKQMSGTGTGTPPALMAYRPGMMDSSNTNSATPVEIDQLLLRFVDVDVIPGLTYEYQIRLRMLNPNFDRPTEVANPVYAKAEVLYSPWVGFLDQITIPPKQFLYAADVATYRKSIEETYANARDPKERELRDRLQVKDNQAVVEICEWKEQVRTDSGKREPVGAWIVADIPVARGEYIGRKQYVKLPLWSSETKSYVLREITSTAGKTGPKEPTQPKGWMVDFSTSTPEILVDFEGGRVQTRLGSKTISEDVDSELLILDPRNGKLTIKKSIVDEADDKRKKIVGLWTKWITEVDKRKEGGGAAGDNFAPKPGMNP